MSWLRSEVDDLYDPSYTDMLRVAFISEFRRGRLEDLVALLSGRNFETRQYEEAIVEDSSTDDVRYQHLAGCGEAADSGGDARPCTVLYYTG